MSSPDTTPGFPRGLGRYVLVREIAAGGMGALFLGVAAGPAAFRKLFAIKTLHPHLSRNTKFVQMFLDEARLAARLSSPNIVQTFELDSVGEQYFIAMEYVHGLSLSQLLRSGPLPIEPAMWIALEACAGLAAAHGATDEQGRALGVIHRDIAPKNVLLSYQGDVKLADFGVARAADQLHDSITGEIKGTLRYMAPEQLEGEAIDARADVYSMGVTLYESFTGRRLFKGISQSKLFDRRIRAAIPPPSTKSGLLPPAIDDVVMKALAPEASDRYQDCAALLGALRQVVAERMGFPTRDQLAALISDRFGEAANSGVLSAAESEMLDALQLDSTTDASELIEESRSVPTEKRPSRAVSQTAETRAASGVGELRSDTVGAGRSAATAYAPTRAAELAAAERILGGTEPSVARDSSASEESELRSLVGAPAGEGDDESETTPSPLLLTRQRSNQDQLLIDDSEPSMWSAQRGPPPGTPLVPPVHEHGATPTVIVQRGPRWPAVIAIVVAIVLAAGAVLYALLRQPVAPAVPSGAVAASRSSPPTRATAAVGSSTPATPTKAKPVGRSAPARRRRARRPRVRVVSAAKKKAKLVQIKLSTTPPGALVEVDGVARGNTPTKVTYPRDRTRTVSVRLALDGHVPVSSRVSLERDTALSFRLQPLAQIAAKKNPPKPRRRKRPKPIERVDDLK